jgi:hypothetical protein
MIQADDEYRLKGQRYETYCIQLRTYEQVEVITQIEYIIQLAIDLILSHF